MGLYKTFDDPLWTEIYRPKTKALLAELDATSIAEERDAIDQKIASAMDDYYAARKAVGYDGDSGSGAVMKLWIVGRDQANWTEEGWYLVGIFDSEEKARAAVRPETGDAGSAIARIEVNRDYGDVMTWPQRGEIPE